MNNECPTIAAGIDAAYRAGMEKGARQMSVECTCGKFFRDQTGADLCAENNHADGKDVWDKRLKFRNTVETEITVVCSDCTARLRAYLRVSLGEIEVNVVPHVCAVDEPEECKGIDLGDGNFSGCTGTGGDCPVCGR